MPSPRQRSKPSPRATAASDAQPGEQPGGAPLQAYREKRRASATPEPFGGGVRAGHPAVGSPALFVVNKHAARRTHFDLRLELDGVLRCWAVPRGPSLDPADKRLAVETEDHPLEYSEFEGVIPDGNYGAGAMITWDRGSWVPLEDPRDGLVRGKLLFELHGHKLHGVWTLFRTKPPMARRGRSKDEDRQWMLAKKPDFAARSGESKLSEASVLSGLTVEELGEGEGPRRVAEVVAQLREAGAVEGDVDPRQLRFMLAQTTEQPFTRPGWIFELKYDGYRLLAAKRGAKVFLRYRNGLDATALFPEVRRALEHMPFQHGVLDGEVVVLGEGGRPSFAGLQQRALLQRPHDIDRAAVRLPATLFCFDLLALEGLDLRRLPLRTRKDALAHLLPQVGPVRYSDHIEERGEAFYAEVERLGLEGIVAKNADSVYVPRRSPDWQKIPCDRRDDFVIVGATAPAGARSGFGALHVASFEPASDPDTKRPELVYAGRVGTGFSDGDLRDLAAALEPARRDTPACSGETPKGKGHLWVEPELVCKVRYKERTPQGMLRHPVFLGLEHDRTVGDLAREAGAVPPLAEAQKPPSVPLKPAAPPAAQPPRLQLTNLDKVFWPEDGYTKGDLVDYYGRIAPAMLPYLADRPLVLTRYPDGIHGKNFFQKNAPDFAPGWIRTVTIWSEGSGRDIEYFVCEDEKALQYLANLATIPIHLWSSRLGSLERPDWCVLDLDPKGAPMEQVVRIAKDIHELCEEIELPSYVKTSGSSGLHVLLPLAGTCTYEQSRMLGLLIAQIVSRRRPEIATIVRNPAKRGGKVYIDTVQNGHGRLIVAPYCVRPLAGAPVSAPLRWPEVKSGLNLGDFNIKSMPERVKKQRKDPLGGVLEDRPDLLGALAKLAEKA
jgi:bifunctional non-homologous end joining protein LigD